MVGAVAFVAWACGGADDDGLRGGTVVPEAGGGSNASGGVPAGSGGAGGAASGGVVSGPGGVGGVILDAGTGGVGLPPFGDAGSSGGAGGEPFVPGGAWAPCVDDTDCTGGRLCTTAIQQSILPGTTGSCVYPCTPPFATMCDPAPPGGTAECPAVFVVALCLLTCPQAVCPVGMTCNLGLCVYP